MSGRTLVMAAAAALAVAPSASAAWSPPQVIPSSPFGEVRLAADDNGNAIAAWGQFSATPTSNRGALFMSRRAAGGAFGTPRPLSPAAHDVRAMGIDVASGGAVSPGGATAIVWRTGDKRGAGRLFVVVGHAAGPLGSPRRLPGTGSLPGVGWPGAASHPADPAVAIANDGTVVVAWLAAGARSCGFVVRATAIAPGGQIGAARRVSGRCPHAADLHAAVDGFGNGAIAWRAGARCNYGTACDYAVQAVPVRHGRFGAPVTVSRRPVAANGVALGAGRGRTIAVWRDAAQVMRALTRGRVMAAVMPRVRRFGRPVALSVSDRIAGSPAVAVSTGGSAVVAWQELDALNGPATVRAVTSGPSSPWSRVRHAGGPTPGMGYAAGPLIAYGTSAAVIGWQSAAGGAMTAAQSHGSTWAVPEPLPDARFGLRLVSGAVNEWLALWTTTDANGRLGPLVSSVRRI